MSYIYGHATSRLLVQNEAKEVCNMRTAHVFNVVR